MDIQMNIHGNETISPVLKAPQDSKQESASPLLLEYETFIGALQKQIDFYKTEHSSLRTDMTGLVTENRRLSDRLKEVLSNKLSREAVLSPGHKKESDMVINLQQQLSFITQEKDSAVEMWHLALREVDSLEEQLKALQDNRFTDSTHNTIEQMKHDFSDAITMLESKLSSTRSSLIKEKAVREELEKKHEAVLQENLSLTAALQSRQRELEEALEGQCATARKLQEVEKRAEELEQKLETAAELELALAKCHEHIEHLVKKSLEAQEKVRESVELAECAIAEKDAVLYREAQLREENAQLQKVMAGIVEEAGAKVKEEVERVKHQYNKKLKVLLHDMNKLQHENKEKEQQLEKESFERRALEGELQKLQMECPVRERDLGEKMSRLHDELAGVRSHNLHLGLEKEDLRSQVDRLQGSHELEVAKMSMENQHLAEQVVALQVQLQEESLVKCEARRHVEALAAQIHVLEQELERVRQTTRNELQNLQHQNYQQDHRELMTKMKEIQKQSSSTAEELQHHLERQRLMKTKYQKAMKTMTERFVKRIQELRAQASTLTQANRRLEKELHQLRSDVSLKEDKSA